MKSIPVGALYSIYSNSGSSSGISSNNSSSDINSSNSISGIPLHILHSYPYIGLNFYVKGRKLGLE